MTRNGLLIGTILLGLGLVLWFGFAFHKTNYESNQSSSDEQIKQEQPSEDKSTTGAKIQKCPTGWYENRMPQAIMPGESPKPVETYLIIDGKNYTEDQVDLRWVVQHCELKHSEVVY